MNSEICSKNGPPPHFTQLHPVKIAFFDSGIGGLSIFLSVQKILPHAHYLYCADYAGYPYGTKENHHVRQMVSDLVEKFCMQHQPDLVVIACNTASTLALDAIRERVAIPVVGVVPGVKPSAKISQTKEIILIATHGTVHSKYISSLIETYALDCKIHKLGSAILVDEAERKIRNLPINKLAIKKELEIFHTYSNADTAILACTHFPFLQEDMQDVISRHINWIEPGPAIGARVIFLLKQAGWSAPLDPKDTVLLDFYKTEPLQSSVNQSLSASELGSFLRKVMPDKICHLTFKSFP